MTISVHSIGYCVSPSSASSIRSECELVHPRNFHHTTCILERAEWKGRVLVMITSPAFSQSQRWAAPIPAHASFRFSQFLHAQTPPG